MGRVVSGVITFMDFIYLSQVLSKTLKIKKNRIFLAKVDESYLVGPLINKSFCVPCFRKRLLSSSIRRIENYKKPLAGVENELKIFLTEKPINLSSNTIIEFDLNKRKIIKKHIVLPIPGCGVCNKNYEQ